MQKRLRRGIATLAVTGLAAGTLALTSTAQAAPVVTDKAPAAAAAKWLVGNLNSAALLEITSAYGTSVSYGTSIDLATALAAAGGNDATVGRITDAIEANLDAYAGAGEEIYAGSTAKALRLLLDQGREAGELQSRLESTVTAEGPAAGRIVDASTWGDYANTIGQAFAATALTAAGSDLAERTTDFLLQQQCSDGFFRLDLAREPMDLTTYYSAPDLTSDQTCDGDAVPEDADQGVDTTALVVLQLAPLAAGDAEVAASVAKAADWLVAQQQKNGSFLDADTGANANTTGLAGWALNEAGRTTAARDAAAWLRGLQVVGACAPGKLLGETGAVAYDAASFAQGAKFGLTDSLDRSQWVMADVQALPALLAAPANTAKDAVVLPTFAKAGSTVTATVTGLAAGERACTTGAVTTDLLGTGKNLTVKLVKAKAGQRTVTLKTATGTVSDTVTVLGAKKFTVALAKTAKAGSKKSVTVKGLAAGEKVTLKVKGKKVVVGKAGKKGTFTTKVKVGSQRGTVKVSVVGQYSNRTGAAKVKVK